MVVERIGYYLLWRISKAKLCWDINHELLLPVDGKDPKGI